MNSMRNSLEETWEEVKGWQGNYKCFFKVRRNSQSDYTSHRETS
jgi:hypothetical protein